jgi:N-dimethylarginine dimethylaminohydrolase
MQRYLICLPDYFDSTFMFNPWMNYDDSVDIDRARIQWNAAVDAIVSAGAEVEILEPSPHSPAQVFTADGAVVLHQKHALVLRNDGPRGTLEPRNFADWLISDGFSIESIPPNRTIDGGNTLRLHDGSLICGVKPGSDGSGERYLEKILQLTTGNRLFTVPLIDRKYLHLDMALGVLGDSGYLVFESAFENGLASLENTPVLDKKIIIVNREDAENFACNGITVGDTFITGNISSLLMDAIEKLGYRVVSVDLSEFHKAGGGLKCLTLPLN